MSVSDADRHAAHCAVHSGSVSCTCGAVLGANPDRLTHEIAAAENSTKPRSRDESHAACILAASLFLRQRAETAEEEAADV